MPDAVREDSLGFVTLVYVLATIAVSAGTLINGMIWSSVALLSGSALGFNGGSGMRGAFYRGTHKSGIVIGLMLLFVGMAVVYYFDVWLQVFELNLSGDTWVLLGFAVGFLAARPEDAGVGDGKAAHAIPIKRSITVGPRSELPPKGVSNKDGREEEPDKWEQAINEFGSIVEQHPLTVFPESHLPLPKDEMKAALKAAWLSIHDSAMRQFIEAGYIQLSHFRPEVTRPIELDLKPDPRLSPEQLAKFVLERKADFLMWNPVNEEARELLSEFADFKARAEA